MEKISISILRGNIIRGLAILAVLLLHFFPYLKGIYHENYQIFFVFIDQLARFCVPAFVMLSGYGLTVKYQDKKIKYFPFFIDRIIKLLPLYLMWSIASIVIISSIPEWAFGNQPMSHVTQVLLGQADYQLYFLPVLLQLYFLFPPLLFLLKKKPKLLLFLAFLIQITLYMLYASNDSNSDRYEYVFSLSWIGYFALGMYLQIATIPKKILSVSPFIALGFLCVVTFVNVTKITAGVDPLPVLKFTKLLLIPQIMFICLSLFSAPKQILKSIPKSTQNTVFEILEWLGKNSYIIFLSHTIGFRIIYAIIHTQLEPFVLLKTIVFWLILIFLSQKILTTSFLRPKKSK